MHLILASKSPRRRELLEVAGFSFTVRTKNVDESWPTEMPVEEVAEYLARKKADAFKESMTPDEIILTADSVVILNNTIYGKPADREDAIRILKELSGNVHRVITGVCLVSHQKNISFSSISDVHMAPFTDAEMNYYIENGNPFDKAGAYGIQEWVGFCKVHRIEGTYANIMGLPIDRVYEVLASEFDVKPTVV